MVSDKDELVRVTQDLIRFRTTKDNLGEMKRCIGYIKSYYKGLPVIIEEHVSNGKPSLFITLRKTKKPAFLMNGHIDVIEADEEQFSPFVKDGKLFGRGAVDMKAGVAACMLAFKKAAQSKKKPDVGLMIVSDEEVSGEDGTGYLVKKGYGGGFVLAAEPNQCEVPGAFDITTDHKGVLWLKITARGVACHGSRPWLGDNAAEKLMRKYVEIKRIFPATTSNDRWKNTMNLGSIHSGDSPNRVPDVAEMTIDIRYTESITPKQIIEKIKSIDDLEVEVIDDSAMLSNKEDHPMILKMQKVAQAVTKKTAKLTKDHGSSDMRFMSALGIPSVVFGPVGKNYHGKEEHVEVESLELFEKVLEAFIEEL